MTPQQKVNELDSPLVAPPVEAKVGCWITRDGSKAVVEGDDQDESDYPFFGFYLTKARGSTFISPDVEYWEKDDGWSGAFFWDRWSERGEGVKEVIERLIKETEKKKPRKHASRRMVR